jgi:hypothetical protein
MRADCETSMPHVIDIHQLEKLNLCDTLRFHADTLLEYVQQCFSAKIFHGRLSQM